MSQLLSQDNATEVRNILLYIRSSGLDLPRFLFYLSYGDKGCINDPTIKAHRTQLLQSPLLPDILKNWCNPPKRANNHTIGARQILVDFSFNLVYELLDKELHLLEKQIKTKGPLSQEELLSLSVSEMIDDFKARSPHLVDLLEKLSVTNERNQIKNSLQMVFMIVCMLMYQRSKYNNSFQQLLSIYWLSCGTPAKVIDLLHTLGLGMSSTWIYEAINNLSQDAINHVQEWVAKNPFAAMHDNVNIAFRVSSQRINHHNHFDNGTAMTILPLPSEYSGILENSMRRATRDDWRIGTNKPTLGWSDIVQVHAAAASPLKRMLIFHIREFLLNHHLFEDLRTRVRDSVVLRKPPAQEPLPSGPAHRTEQWPIVTVPIDESSLEGTSNVIENLLTQIGLSNAEDKKRLAISRMVMWMGDQKTVGLMRHLRGMRGEDLNGFSRLDWMILVKGWFHTQMALQNQICWIHRGTLGGSGIMRDLKVLERVGLAPKTRQQKLDFYQGHQLLLHMIEAHILDAWMEIAGAASLEALAEISQEWTPLSILDLAEKLYEAYIFPRIFDQVDWTGKQNDVDKTFVNAALFMRDALMYYELHRAIKEGDVGRMRNVMPNLLFMFAGGNNPHYTIELLEEFQMELYDLTPVEMSIIRRYCWLVNMKGGAATFFPMDQLQEHNIRAIKHVYAPQGSNVSWEYLGKISPLIPLFLHIGYHIDKIFGGGKKGKKHSDVDRGKDVEMLVKLYQSEKIHQQNVNGRFTPDGLNTNVFHRGLHNLRKKSLVEWVKGRDRYQHKTQQDLHELTMGRLHGWDEGTEGDTLNPDVENDEMAFTYEGENGEGYAWDSDNE